MIVFFALLGISCKRKIPEAHTSLEVVRVRYGSVACEEMRRVYVLILWLQAALRMSCLWSFVLLIIFLPARICCLVRRRRFLLCMQLYTTSPRATKLLTDDQDRNAHHRSDFPPPRRSVHLHVCWRDQSDVCHFFFLNLHLDLVYMLTAQVPDRLFPHRRHPHHHLLLLNQSVHLQRGRLRQSSVRSRPGGGIAASPGGQLQRDVSDDDVEGCMSHHHIALSSDSKLTSFRPSSSESSIRAPTLVWS